MAIIRDTATGLLPVIRPYIPKARTVFVVVLAFLVGLVWAYVIDPTVFYDSQPSQLEQSWQNAWVELLAAAKASGSYSDETIVEWLRAVDNPVSIVDDLINTSTSQITVDRLQELRPLAEQAEPGTPAPQPTILASLRPWVLGPIVIAIAAVLISLLYGFYIQPMVVEPIQKRRQPTSESDAGTKAEIAAIQESRRLREAMQAEVPVNIGAADLGPPVSRHISIYTPGRQYDDSFSIETADEEFLGECGVAISETIGVGAPEKVSAIEVWLFDKEDFVRTITQVFASEHAYNDPAIRSKLEPKGEIILATPGAVAVLETNTLRLQARIVDMQYGTGPLPPNSYFEKLTIELATWRKEGAAVGVPAPMAAAPAVPTPAPSYAPPPPAPAPAVPSSFEDPGPAPMGGAPAQRPFGGSGITPLKPPPMQSPPPPRPSPPPPADDDPFGGTGDFTPIS
jgi:hypothetical protein